MPAIIAIIMVAIGYIIRGHGPLLQQIAISVIP